MAGTLIFLLSSSLLQGALCGMFNIKMPQNLNVLRGSCVTIPCSFDVESKYENNLDDTCKAYWSDSTSFTTENGKLNPTKDMTGDLTKKDCTTTFNNANLLQRSIYYFRLECNNALKYTFTQSVVDISFIDHPPSPTLTPSILEVKEGTSVSVTCSAPAPCWSHPPALTWTPNLGQSQETLQENQDKTKVKTSVVSFTASHLHHGNKISCTAVYRKQHGSPDVTAETSLTPVISYSPKDVNISVSSYGPVVENREVTLTCSSNANPAVENYTWYRADGDKETFIGSGRTLNVAVSTINSIFFCKATNTLGFEQSSKLEIDVQFPPKDVNISVSSYGPVVENREVTLTCSSNANPAVENYTWYRADGDKETFMGSGRTLNVAVSTINSIFFCKATNTLGFEQSSNLEIDVQYSPKNVIVSVSPSGPVPENSNVTLTCSSNANPAVRNYTWYRADGDQETFIGTGSSVNVAVSKVKSFFCKATNTLGFKQSSNLQIDVQYSPKDVNISVSSYGPVVENREVTLTCSSNANPAVENYTWYRADGDKETFIGTGRTLNVAVSTIKSIFFCKATNTLGFEQSSNLEIDVQYSPKNVIVSVSPSGPVPENSNVTLTCSSNANPAVRNYTWYRADGDQETFIGTGSSVNVAVSKVKSFFCKATNTLGFKQSSNLQIDVQYSPKNVTVSVSPSGPVPENSNVTLTCSSNANPAVRNYTWYRADGDQETFIGTGTSLNIKVSRDRRTFFCNAENEIGVGRSSSMQIDAQYSILYPVIFSAITALLLVPICVVLFSIRAQINPCKPKGQLPDESNTAATRQPITMEENEAPKTLEDSIYANTDWLKVPENIHLATIAGPSNTNLPNFRANNEEGESENSGKEDSCDTIYSNVN